MITSFSSPKTKIPLSSDTKSSNGGSISTNINTNKFKNYKDSNNFISNISPSNKNIKNINFNPQNEKEKENKNINPNETLSNIIDAINENNLNDFYEDDSSNFKRNIDQLNLKFYLETEKIIKSSNNNNEFIFNSNKLFLILFKQINLYISEIERLNVIILDSKRDPHSISKKLSVMNKQKSDFEVKEQIIKTLKFSISSLEKQLANVLNSENLLRQENKKLQEEKKFYLDFYIKYNNKENKNSIKENIKDNSNYKIMINNRYNNIKLNNSNSNSKCKNKIHTTNNYFFKYKTNNSINNNLIVTNSYNNSSKKSEKKKLESNRNNNSNSNNKINNNKENGSNKKNDIILLTKHRRTYSAQNEEMINSLNKKIDKMSQGIIQHANTKTSRLTKQENKNPTKIINNNLHSPGKNLGLTSVGIYKNNNKIIQSVKDGMKEKYLNRKKKNNMNYNYSGGNKFELILNKDSEASFMKYKSSIYGNIPQFQTTTNGTIREEENFDAFNKINNIENSYNLNYNAKNNFIKNNDNNLAELEFMEDIITEVRDYLAENKNKINENKKNCNNEIKLKDNKRINNINNAGTSQNATKNLSFKTWASIK